MDYVAGSLKECDFDSLHPSVVLALRSKEIGRVAIRAKKINNDYNMRVNMEPVVVSGLVFHPMQLRCQCADGYYIIEYNPTTWK